jgi:hypothetical protein
VRSGLTARSIPASHPPGLRAEWPASPPPQAGQRSRAQSAPPVPLTPRPPAPTPPPGQQARRPRPALPRDSPAPNVAATGSAGRRSPARRSSGGHRSKCTARPDPPFHSVRPSPPPSLPRPPRPASPRSSRDATAWPCSRRASGWRRSCHHPARCLRMTRSRRHVHERTSRPATRCRPRDAGRPHTGGRDRTRTGGAPARPRARSTPAQPTSAARVQTRSTRGLAAQFPPCCQV